MKEYKRNLNDLKFQSTLKMKVNKEYLKVTTWKHATNAVGNFSLEGRKSIKSFVKFQILTKQLNKIIIEILRFKSKIKRFNNLIKRISSLKSNNKKSNKKIKNSLKNTKKFLKTN